MAQWAKDPFVKTKKKGGKKSQKSAAKKTAKQAPKKAPKKKAGKPKTTARPNPTSRSAGRCAAVANAAPSPSAPAQPPSAIPPRATPRRQPNAASARRGGSTTAARPARAPPVPATLPPAAPQHPPNAAPARRSRGTATRQPARAPPAPATPPPAASGSLPTSAPSRGRGRAAAPAGRRGSTSAARRSAGNVAPGGSSTASRPVPPPTTPRARPSAGPARKRGRAASEATPTPSASAPRASGTNDAAGPFPSSTSCTAPPKKRGRPPGSTKEALKRRRALARRSARGTSPQPSTSGAPPPSPPTSRSTSAAPSGRGPSATGQVASSSRPRTSRVRRTSPSPRAPRSRSASAEHGARTTRSAAALARFADARTRAQRSAIQQTLTTSHAPAPRRSGSAGGSPTPPAPPSAPRNKRERLLAVSSSTQQTTPPSPAYDPVAATSPRTPPAAPEGHQLSASPSPAYVPNGSANPSPTYWPQPEDQQPTGFFPFSPGAHLPSAQWTAAPPPANGQSAGQGSQSSSSTPRSVPSTSGLPPRRRATQRIPVVPNPLAPNRVQRLLANASPPPPAQRAPITSDTPLSNGTDARDNRDPSPLAQQGRQQADFGTRDTTGSPQGARPHIDRKLAGRLPSPPPAKRARASDPVQNGLSGPQRPQPSAPQPPPPPQRYNSGFSSRRAVQPVAPQVRQPTGGIVSAAINRWMGTGSRRDVVVVEDDDDILIEEVVLAPPPRDPQLCVPIGGGLDWRDWTPEQVVEWAEMWGAADGIIEEMRRTSMDGRRLDQLFQTNNNMADGRRFHFSNTQVAEMWNHITLVFRALRGSRPQR